MSRTADLPARNRLYWAVWRDAKNELAARGFDAAEIEDMRHDCHRLALDGQDPSSQQIIRRQEWLTPVLREFRVYAAPDDLGSQIGHEPRDVIIAQIARKGLPDRYLDRISRDQFRTSDWRTLDLKQLIALRHTATRASRRKKSGEPF